MNASVRYSILGAVRAVRGETELEIGPPKRLALLSLLLLRAPEPVTLNEAVDVLWDRTAPSSAVNVVHRHIGGLRRTLEPGLPSRTQAEHLVRTAGGYRLLVDTSTSDLLRFRGLRAQAQQAVRAGEPARAARYFLEAVRLWRDPVVAAGTPVARHPLFTSVGHEFVATAKEAADVVLTAAPRATEEVLTALCRAVDHHPLDEALHSRIIAALAATGRQGEALRQYEIIRRTLAEDLGAEPGPDLRAARERLLRLMPSDGATGPALVPASSRVPTVPLFRSDGVARPAQLPGDCVPFTGRGQAVEQCMELLPTPAQSRSYGTTTVLCGMPGVGKTTLAVHWAHRIADRFPGGQIHLDLQGHHPTNPPLTSRQAMREILDALDVTGTSASDTALTSLYRTTLANRRLLVLLDDARDCEQVRPLLPATSGTLAIVTSRRRLEGLTVTDNAHVITVHPMTPAEGLEFLDRRLGIRRTRAEPNATREIVDLCAGLPLALAVTAARADANPTFPLTALAAHLRADTETLDTFAGWDSHTDPRRRFDHTYRCLSPGAAHLFRLLSLHPAAEITVPSALSLTGGNDPRIAQQHIVELTDHHLLTEQAPGHYTCHPLLRTYAGELNRAHDDPVTRNHREPPAVPSVSGSP
ncbi:DNA-binding SARP family transcriptional activator [Streptomyces canus]|uniref:DNA-binding SARP family transcriptional activator n=1 Tax=Streptomyces canus TaxID=58343 RepID=A0AAW8FP71_9ACTN|nr:BTAD domain-containing putative transcriptional regulator [Streptomyces canus]MDQ0911030.1 DNA-binding SARP family transcriptional activator [Streptomyces canus]